MAKKEDLNVEIARFVLPRLRQYREENISFPAGMKSIDEWNGIIDRMIWSLGEVAENYPGLREIVNGAGGEELQRTCTRNYSTRLIEGMACFGKYFYYLCD